MWYYERVPHWSEQLKVYLANLTYTTYVAGIENFSDKNKSLEDFFFDFSLEEAELKVQDEDDMRHRCQLYAVVYGGGSEG